MDTVGLLNHYRTSAARDPLAFRILAHLFQQGSCSDTELESVSESAAEMREKLVVLFRSSLVRRNAQSWWTTTDLAKLILARAGVAQQSIGWFVEAWDLPEEVSAFLKLCAFPEPNVDPEAALRQQSLVQALWHIKSHVKSTEARPEDLRKALYAAVVGLDSRAESLGQSAYCDHVFRHSGELRFASGGGRKRLQALVKAALRSARESSTLLFAGNREVGKSALVLSWARLMNAASNKLVDESLFSMAEAADRQLPASWECLVNWKRDLNSESLQVLRTLGHGSPVQSRGPEDVIVLLKSRLRAASKVSTQRLLLGSKVEEFAFGSTKEALSSSAAMIQLRGLARALEEGSFDSIALAEKEGLSNELDQVARAFRMRLMGNQMKDYD